LNLSNAQIAEELGLNPNDVQRMTEQLRTGSLSASLSPCCAGRWSATRSTSSPVTKGIRARSKRDVGVGGDD
jgi:hypothetical protein